MEPAPPTPPIIPAGMRDHAADLGGHFFLLSSLQGKVLFKDFIGRCPHGQLEVQNTGRLDGSEAWKPPSRGLFPFRPRWPGDSGTLQAPSASLHPDSSGPSVAPVSEPARGEQVPTDHDRQQVTQEAESSVPPSAWLFPVRALCTRGHQHCWGLTSHVFTHLLTSS